MANKPSKGVSTGACAQAAAKACALMLLNQKKVSSVEITLPAGMVKRFDVKKQKFTRKSAHCSVIKYSSDPGDVTDGIEICCYISKTETGGVSITGGSGVGIVTRPGLAVPAGKHAINPVPRAMISREVTALLPIDKGFSVTISVPRGKEIAPKTYNPRLGIQGGISIIGTTGIVEPKSEDAYKRSLSLELNVAKAAGHKTIFLASGYIGENLLKQKFAASEDAIIKIGDHVGFMLKECVQKNIRNVVLAGHIGKLVKVAGAIFNTHSKHGDARLEIIAAYAAACGAKTALVRKLLKLKLAEESVELLKKNKLTRVFDIIAQKAVEKSLELCENKLTLQCLLLTLEGNIAGSYPSWKKFI